MIVLIVLSALLATSQSFPLQDWIVEIPGQDWKTLEDTPNRFTLMHLGGPETGAHDGRMDRGLPLGNLDAHPSPARGGLF